MSAVGVRWYVPRFQGAAASHTLEVLAGFFTIESRPQGSGKVGKAKDVPQVGTQDILVVKHVQSNSRPRTTLPQTNKRKELNTVRYPRGQPNHKVQVMPGHLPR